MPGKRQSKNYGTEVGVVDVVGALLVVVAALTSGVDVGVVLTELVAGVVVSLVEAAGFAAGAVVGTLILKASYLASSAFNFC